MTKRLLLYIFIMISIAIGMALIPFHNSTRLDGVINDRRERWWAVHGFIGVA